MANEFIQSIRLNNEKIMKELQGNYLKVVDDLFISVVELTPVKTGALINNWFTSTGSDISSQTTNVLDLAGSGSLLSIENLHHMDLFNGKDTTVSMTNNLPYAINAEYEGWEKTAPYAMVRNSINKVVSEYEL